MQEIVFERPRSSRLWAWVKGPRLLSRAIVRQTRGYWTARRLVDRVAFGLRRRLYHAATWGKATTSSFGLLSALVRSITGQVVVAAALVGAAFVADHFFSANLRAPTHASPGVRDLLNTIAQIAGVVLTLYYTALSVVISTGYGDVSADLRHLIVREKSSYLYIKLLALTCASSLMLLALDSYAVPVSGIPFLAVLGTAILAVLSFVALGLNAFRFFDPAVLANQLTDEFAQMVQGVVSRSYGGANGSFHNYFRQRAAEALATYKNVISASAKAPHQHYLGSLAVRLAVALASYAKIKPAITSDSLWFPRSFKHPRWLLASDYTVSMAIQTGTSLQPESVPEHYWVENESRNQIIRVLAIAAESGAPDVLPVVASSVRRAAACLSDAGDLTSALIFIREANVTLADKPMVAVSREGKLANLAAHEEICLALIECVLGFRRHAERAADVSAVGRIGAEFHRNGRLLIEPSIVSAGVAADLRRYGALLSMERRLERSLITPEWYTVQFLARLVGTQISTNASTLVAEIETFVEQCGRAGASAVPLLSLQVAQRGFELIHKMEVALDRAGETCTALAGLRVADDASWETPDIQALEVRLDSARRTLGVKIASIAPLLGAESDSDDLPDYAGFAYTILSGECFRAMKEGDEKAFAQVFDSFFDLAFGIGDRLAKSTLSFGVEARVLLQAEPVFDLLELSGYAELFSALGGKSFSKVARERWDQYVAKRPNSAEVVKFLALVASLKSSAFGMSPRDSVRMDWRSQFDRHLVRLGLASERMSWPDPSIAKRRTHPLVRALPEGGLGLGIHGRDVFFARYLARRAEAVGLNFGRAAEELQSEMASEKEESIE